MNSIMTDGYCFSIPPGNSVLPYYMIRKMLHGIPDESVCSEYRILHEGCMVLLSLWLSLYVQKVKYCMMSHGCYEFVRMHNYRIRIVLLVDHCEHLTFYFVFC